MASTYSNLKIQLMTTGENSTTWGTVTNTNLGTAIEEAIVGSADVTFASANVTLTLTDTNSTQAARNVRLRCTGTTGGSTRNLVVPSIEKPYIVQNDCADSIVVKTAAGTGITVPAGKTLWVYNDSVNVVDSTTYLSSLTLGTALPVLSGGTGATDAATARANIGAGVGTVTSVSGTGTVNGLSLSGTVTSSGSLTLGGTLSGVSLTAQVTGTLPIANGGTNATSAAAALTSLGAYPATNPSGYTTNVGTVTSVATTGTVNGITLTGSVTTSGTLTLGGTLSGVSLTAQVSGVLPVANGGTNASDAATARSNLGAAGSGTNTDITVMNPAAGLQVGSPTGGAKGVGTINATGLFVNGSAVGVGSGSVTSVAASVPAFLSIAGSPITTSGTLAITLSGSALPIANGGTNATSAAAALTSLGAYPATNPNGYTSNAGTVTSVAGTGSTNGLSLSGTVTSAGNITLSGSVTSVATGATIDGVTIGYRSIPRSTTTSTATTADVGKCIAITAAIAIPNSTFAAGDAVSIYNNSAGALTIAQASGLTLRLAGTGTTGDRTLAARGMATVWFNSTTEAVISGAGVS